MSNDGLKTVCLTMEETAELTDEVFDALEHAADMLDRWIENVDETDGYSECTISTVKGAYVRILSMLDESNRITDTLKKAASV